MFLGNPGEVRALNVAVEVVSAIELSANIIAEQSDMFYRGLCDGRDAACTSSVLLGFIPCDRCDRS